METEIVTKNRPITLRDKKKEGISLPNWGKECRPELRRVGGRGKGRGGVSSKIMPLQLKEKPSTETSKKRGKFKPRRLTKTAWAWEKKEGVPQRGASPSTRLKRLGCKAILKRKRDLLRTWKEGKN